MITYGVKTAVNISAPLTIVDPISIANAQTALGAVTPDRMLDELRKNRREAAVELSGVNVRRELFK